MTPITWSRVPESSEPNPSSMNKVSRSTPPASARYDVRQAQGQGQGGATSPRRTARRGCAPHRCAGRSPPGSARSGRAWPCPRRCASAHIVRTTSPTAARWPRQPPGRTSAAAHRWSARPAAGPRSRWPARPGGSPPPSPPPPGRSRPPRPGRRRCAGRSARPSWPRPGWPPAPPARLAGRVPGPLPLPPRGPRPPPRTAGVEASQVGRLHRGGERGQGPFPGVHLVGKAGLLRRGERRRCRLLPARRNHGPGLHRRPAPAPWPHPRGMPRVRPAPARGPPRPTGAARPAARPPRGAPAPPR